MDLKFAARIQSLVPEAAYEVMAKAQQLEADGRDIIHLEIGQPDFETFAHIGLAGIQCKNPLGAFYAFPKRHWKTIRTTNIIERLFGEVKKRSHKMAAAFRNENSCLLMFYATIRSLRFQNVRMDT